MCGRIYSFYSSVQLEYLEMCIIFDIKKKCKQNKNKRRNVVIKYSGMKGKRRQYYKEKPNRLQPMAD